MCILYVKNQIIIKIYSCEQVTSSDLYAYTVNASLRNIYVQSHALRVAMETRDSWFSTVLLETLCACVSICIPITNICGKTYNNIRDIRIECKNYILHYRVSIR